MTGVSPAALKSLLYGIRDIWVGGVKQSLRPAINFTTGVSCTDNPARNRLDISVIGQGLEFVTKFSGATLDADKLNDLSDNESPTPSFVLPAPASWTGRRIVAKRLNQAASEVTLTAAGGALIDGAASYTLAGSSIAVEFYSDGTRVLVGASSPTSLGIAEPFSSVVTIARNGVQTATANSDGRIVWGLAPTGHATGASKTLEIPPNTVVDPEDLVLSPDMNVANAAAFDPAKRCHVFVSCFGTHFSGLLEVVEARDATAPALVSATVREGDKDAIELLFAEPVILRDAALVTMSYSAGTSRTITGYQSGNGTTLITLDMSGDWDGTETATVTIAANAFQDLNGNLSAADTEAISNQADGVVFSNTIGYWRSDSVVESGGVVSAMTDRSGEGNHVNNLIAIQQPGLLASRINGHPSVNFDGTDDFLANYDIKIGGAEPTDLNSYTILAVVKFDTTTAESLFSAFPDSPATIFEGILILLEVGNMKLFAPNSASQAIKAFSSTGWNEIRFEITQAQRRMWINGVLQTDDGGNWNTVADTPPLKGVRIGLESNGTYGQMNGELAELRYIGRTLTAPEATQWDSYVASRYAL